MVILCYYKCAFKWFIDFSPRLRYLTYEIGGFEQYDTRNFVMMDIRNGKTVLEWKTNGSNCSSSIRQPNGARFFYIVSNNTHESKASDIVYTSSKAFPRTLKLFSTFIDTTKGIASITFSKSFLVVTEWYDGMDGICSWKKYRYHVYRLNDLE